MASLIVYDPTTREIRSIACNSIPHTRDMRRAVEEQVPGCRVIWTRQAIPPVRGKARLHLPTRDDPRLYVERVPETDVERAERAKAEAAGAAASRAQALVRAKLEADAARALAATETDPAVRAALLDLASRG